MQCFSDRLKLPLALNTILLNFYLERDHWNSKMLLGLKYNIILGYMKHRWNFRYSKKQNETYKILSVEDVFSIGPTQLFQQQHQSPWRGKRAEFKGHSKWTPDDPLSNQIHLLSALGREASCCSVLPDTACWLQDQIKTFMPLSFLGTHFIK